MGEEGKGMSVTLANGGSKDRRELDYYPTPPEVTEALMQFLVDKLPLGVMSVHEPACGEGMMSGVLRKYFRSVVESDISQGLDYLGLESQKCHCIITNPPFSKSREFIEKAVKESNVVAMLLKSQYWHSSRRRALFLETTPAYVLPLTWRPDFYFGAKSGSPTMEVLWTVWIGGFTGCLYYPLGRP